MCTAIADLATCAAPWTSAASSAARSIPHCAGVPPIRRWRNAGCQAARFTGLREHQQATLADAILDRLVHGSHRLELKGGSMRKARADAELVDAATLTERDRSK